MSKTAEVLYAEATHKLRRLEKELAEKDEKLVELNRTVTGLKEELEEWILRAGEAIAGEGPLRSRFMSLNLGLTRMEHEVLFLLCRSSTGVTKSHFMASLYGTKPDKQPSDKVLDVYICKLRDKLESKHGLPRDTVETIWARGYRINSDHRDALIKVIGFDPAKET